MPKIIYTGILHLLFYSTQYIHHPGKLDQPNLTPSPARLPHPYFVQFRHMPVGIHVVKSYNLLGGIFDMISLSIQLIPR